jgi:hypothetical protein
MIINQSMNFIFLFEIIITLFTAQIDETGAVNDDLRLLFRDYATSWLALDVISIFPFEFLNSSLTSLNLIGKILRVLKLSKIYKMVSNLKRL